MNSTLRALLLSLCFAPALLARGILPATAPRTEDPVARVPYQYLAHQVVLEATIGDHGPLRLVLDTGMPIPGLLLFQNERVAKLGLEDSGQRVRVGGGGSEDQAASAVIARGLEVKLGTLEIPSTQALVMDTPPGFPPDMDGVIGGELFFSYVVRIDQREHRLDLWKPEGYTPPEAASVVPLEREGGFVFVELRVAVGDEEPRTARVVVDTGAGHALSLNARPDGGFAAPGNALRVPIGRGVSGPLEGSVGRVRRVELGGHVFEDVVVTFPDPAFQKPGGTDHGDGNLGEQILGRFTVTFDHAGGRMILEALEGRDQPFEFAMTALQTSWNPDATLVVDRVPEGSPEEKAGFQAGDVVIAVDGTPTQTLGSDGFRRLLFGDGEARRFTIRRGDAVLEISFTLRRLL